MKPTLDGYLGSHTCKEFTDLKNDCNLSLFKIQTALLKAETVNDYVALRTLVQRNFKCKESLKLVENICLESANASFEINDVYASNDLNTISFITNFPVDQHLNIFLLFLVPSLYLLV